MKPPQKTRVKGKAPLSDSKREPSQALKTKRTKPLLILVPVDIASPSRKALDFAGDFARRYNGRVVLLSVIDDEYSSRAPAHPLVLTQQAFQDRVSYKLSDLGARHVGAERILKSVIHSGAPAEQILKLAAEIKPDFIIMATHGYTGLKHMLLGSTAERVIRTAPCPVLTLRETAKTE